MNTLIPSATNYMFNDFNIINQTRHLDILW
jgi:hypothetical protein